MRNPRPPAGPGYDLLTILREGRLTHDFAFGAYFFCGLVMVLVSGLSVAPVAPESAAALGLLLVMPLILLSVVAVALGLVLTLVLWPNRPLNVLAVLSLVVLAEVAFRFGGPGVLNALGWVYAVVATAIPLWWFLRARLRFSAGGLSYGSTAADEPPDDEEH